MWSLWGWDQVLLPMVQSELSHTWHRRRARATCPLSGHECFHGTPSEHATTCGVGAALLGTHPYRLELHNINLHDDGVLHGMQCGVRVPPTGQHSVMWGEPPSTAALLHLSHGSALEWGNECELEELCPPRGTEVVLREGLKRSLCEEAVQMYFPSCINQLEGSKGS